jgi:hypothetical protein
MMRSDRVDAPNGVYDITKASAKRYDLHVHPLYSQDFMGLATRRELFR